MSVGFMTRPKSGWIYGIGIALAVGVLTPCFLSSAQTEGPSIEEYVASVGGATIVNPGDLKIDEQLAICGQRPTVLNNKLDDYGAAFDGFVILNPKFLDKVPTVVKLWIYGHECGHQFRGPDEAAADCFAVQRGRRQKWLDEAGLEEICKFISPAKATSKHFSGPERCEAMRKCFADTTVR